MVMSGLPLLAEVLHPPEDRPPALVEGAQVGGGQCKGRGEGTGRGGRGWGGPCMQAPADTHQAGGAAPGPPATIGRSSTPPTPTPHPTLARLAAPRRCLGWWAATASACCCCGRRWSSASTWGSPRLAPSRWGWLGWLGGLGGCLRCCAARTWGPLRLPPSRWGGSLLLPKGLSVWALFLILQCLRGKGVWDGGWGWGVWGGGGVSAGGWGVSTA